jgi:hypothetical protein
MKIQMLEFTQSWDKTFPKSEEVTHSKVTFHNRYGITLAADMYMPKNVEGKLTAIAVAGPFGAVKEQSSGLYAQTMAERGFLRLLLNPLIRAKAVVNRDMLRPLTSTQRILARLWISFPHRRMSIRKESVSLVSVVGVEWR